FPYATLFRSWPGARSPHRISSVAGVPGLPWRSLLDRGAGERPVMAGCDGRHPYSRYGEVTRQLHRGLLQIPLTFEIFPLCGKSAQKTALARCSAERIAALRRGAQMAAGLTTPRAPRGGA